MNISIGNLTITNFCTQNPEHVTFKCDLVKDQSIYDFVSTNIGDDLIVPTESDDLELDHSYVIEDNHKPIGYIYIEGLSQTQGVVELRYAVHPEYRRLGFLGYSDSNRRGYGQQILEECSNYLFTFEDINSIELHIRKDNEASIGCAEKAKYKCIGEYKAEYYYIYRMSRGSKTYEN